MGLITEEVEVNLGRCTDSWYENKGYIVPKIKNKWGNISVPTKTKIKIKVIDLTENSHIKIKCQCDGCSVIKQLAYQQYFVVKKEENKYYCKRCINKLYGAENSRKTKLDNGTSFEQWCVENNKQDVLNLWDYELNEWSPSEIAYGSGKKCWFKCSMSIHNSELKKLNDVTNNREDGLIRCNKCNSLGQWMKNIYGEDALDIYWSDKNTIDPFEIEHGSSGKKVWIKCPICGNEKLITPNVFIYKGLSCPKCGDGISYPEKFMFSFLKQLNVNFITQLNKTTLKWCRNEYYDFKYDFFVSSKEKYIIETHGRQHYEEHGFSAFGGRTLKEEQTNDKNKKELALKNGIKVENYIVIDCRESEIEWIKNSIINSRIADIYNISNIDWLECQKYAISSLVVDSCNLWKLNKSALEISKLLHICQSTVSRYLKKGTELGWCDYNGIEESKKHHIRMYRKVYCLELNKRFNSLIEAGKYVNRSTSSISSCCIGRTKTCAGYHWMFYEDYLKLHNEIETNKSLTST